MRKIFQTKSGFAQGNCVWACIASLFDLDLADLDFPPPSNTDLLRWTQDEMPHLTHHNIDFAHDYTMREVEGVEGLKWTYELGDWTAPETEFWMASVNSRQLKTPPESEWYPMPALHAVVMRGDKLWHDPQPKNPRVYDPVIVQATWWEPND